MPRLPQPLSDPVNYKRSGLRTSEAGSNKGSNETITFPIPKIGSTAIRVPYEYKSNQPTNQRSPSPLYSGYSADEVLSPSLTHHPQTGNTGRTMLEMKVNPDRTRSLCPPTHPQYYFLTAATGRNTTDKRQYDAVYGQSSSPCGMVLVLVTLFQIQTDLAISRAAETVENFVPPLSVSKTCLIIENATE
ncbi:hypothetical protein B9Z19DRAFT_1110366 [Tuber borchii]|uniref:Uncharacterized protein n=1 Tax=Tuber borchii TaxID=42251 RepID=A0A2T6ZHL1_TUBBO|nr:hypothetical protein B9Z19DRAFT_1110366 [Tuber borchii]